MQAKKYSNVMNLEKTQAKNSIWPLRITFMYHQKALLKQLSEGYVPTGTSGKY